MFDDILWQKQKHINNLNDIVVLLKSDATLSHMLRELVKAVRLILPVLMTTCTAERTFLRSTMTQARLNNVTILNCHREYLDGIDIDQCVNEIRQ